MCAACIVCMYDILCAFFHTELSLLVIEKKLKLSDSGSQEGHYANALLKT